MSELNPYQTPHAVVADPAIETTASEPANRGTRLGAQILNTLFTAIPMIAIFAGVGVLQRSSAAQENLGMVLIGAGLLGMLALLVINLVMLYRHGQSLGKRILKIRITRQNGERAGLARIVFLRMLIVGLLGNIPYAGPFISLVDALFIFRGDRRCLHDLIADTIVVKA